MHRLPYFASRPLRAQIAIVASTIALIVALCIGAGAVLASRAQTLKLVNADLGASAGVMADRLGRAVEARVRELTFLSELEPIQEFWHGDPGVVRRAFELLRDGSGIYSAIAYAGRDGQIFAATEGLREGTSVAGHAWFEQGLIGSYVGDVHPVRTATGDGPSTEEEVFDISVPVYGADGELVGVLGARVTWTWMARVRDATSASDLRPSTEILVLDRDGTALLGAPLGTRIMSEDEAGRIYRSGEGMLEDEEGGYLVAASVMTGREGARLGWIAVTRQPVDVALAPVRQLTWIIMAIGAVATLLGLMLSSPLAESLARPLRALTDEADRLGRDPGQGMPGMHRGSEEIARLSAALHSLLQRLGVEEQLRLKIEEESGLRTDRLVADLRHAQSLAEIDPLTGLRNRRSFEEAARFEERTAVITIDIDHFKQVNDRFGHGYGDEVLKKVARNIGASVRTSDLAVRYGGEEFVVVLRDADPRVAARLADRIRQNIERSVRLPDGSKVTVSMGVSVWREGDSLSSALAASDRELYRAKESGRNRVCVEELDKVA